MTYAAAIWHDPSGTREAKKTHAKKLAVEQNRCLRTVLGAYKATSAAVLEAESSMPSIQIALDQAVLSRQALRGIHPVTKTGNARIWKNLRRKRQRRQRGKQEQTPAEEKEIWALKSLGYASWEEAKGPGSGTSNRTRLRKKVMEWVEEEKLREWRKYRDGVQPGRSSPAQRGDLKNRLALHKGLKKAESSLATQMRTEKIGLAAFLYARRVPGVESASCTCGWRRQDVKHVLMFCPEREEGRKAMLEAAGTKDCKTLLTTNAGLKASAKWLMKSDLLGLYSLAREQLYRT